MAEDTVVTGFLMLGSMILTYVTTNFEKWREQYAETKRRRREAVGQALSILLEVYHQAAVYRCLNELLSLGDMAETKAVVMRMVKSIAPDVTPLTKEYDNAVQSLASEYPVLASQIRDTHRQVEMAQQILSMLAAEVESTGSLGPEATDAQRFLDEFSRLMHAEVFDHLGDKVQQLAAEHSSKTRDEVFALRARKALLKWEVVGELESKMSSLRLPENERIALKRLFVAWRTPRSQEGAAAPGRMSE